MATQLTVQKLEQGRASFAFDEIQRHVKNDKVKNDELRSYIKKMPSMIQVNGLGQTLAFYYSKKSSKSVAYASIYSTIEKWIKDKFPEHFIEHTELVQMVINISSNEYRLVTLEVMALLDWMRKFVSGMTDGSDTIDALSK